MLQEENSLLNHPFLITISDKSEKTTNDLITKNSQFLISDDPVLICQSINFFCDNISKIDFSILNQILNVKFLENYDICDCLNDFLEIISKQSKFLEETEFSMPISIFLIHFSNLNEPQFVVTAYQSLSNFIYKNKNVAIYLLDNGFFNQCFERFRKYTQDLCINNESDDQENDYLYLLSYLFKIFSSLFFHSDLITSNYSNLVVKCFHILLSLQITDVRTALKIKVFVFDNISWFATSASNESIQSLMTPLFFANMNFLLNLDTKSLCLVYECTEEKAHFYQNNILYSVFECIGKITSHDDELSFPFIQPPIELLNKIYDSQFWNEETKLSFLKILRNFSACKNKIPSSFIMSSPELTNFLKHSLSNCPFKLQKEAYIIIFNLVLFKEAEISEYILTNFTEFFPLLITFLSTENGKFNELCIYSITILASYLESKSKESKTTFLNLFSSTDWTDYLNELAAESNENISKLALSLIEEIEE